jgi:multidrug efflux system outer membrane protein
VFHAPELQQLIRTALANNYDLRIAAERILEQQAQLKIVRAQQFPVLSGGGIGAGAQIPDSLGQSIQSPVAVGSFSLTASWTPDFWGLYRRQTEAARAELMAQTWARRAVQLTLVQEVATTYLQLRAFDEELAVTRQTLEIRSQSLNLTRAREHAGYSPLSDVREAEALRYAAAQQVPILEQQIQETENNLRLLLGQDPGPLTHIDPNALAPAPSSLPVGLPSQLLERRPDIQQAEQTLVAANARVGVAKAQFFPQISLGAIGGFGGDEFSNLFGSNSGTAVGLGSVTQAIFEGGRLRGQLQLSEHQKQEMVLNYQKTVIASFRDVSNALIAARKQRSAREQKQGLVMATQDAERLAHLRYVGGATGYLEVLTIDSNLYAAQITLIDLERGEALSLVQLYGALGGGWQ